MFVDLIKQIDAIAAKYGGSAPEKMKSDLLELVQKAIEYGEAKDQNKITGIVVKGIKALLGGKD